MRGERCKSRYVHKAENEMIWDVKMKIIQMFPILIKIKIPRNI